MDGRHPQRWARVAMLVGVTYFLIGRLFAIPSEHVRSWRLAAWVVSGAVYAAHIWYERFKLHSRSRSMALHAALAVATGAFALAVAGMVRSLVAGPGFRPSWLLALVAWPLVSGVPAFLVAVVAGALLARLPRTG